MGHSVHELALGCQVSTRTIYRDLRLLAEAGVDVHYDANAGGHVVISEYSAAALRGFTWDDLAVLALAARTSCLLPMRTVRSSVDQSVSRILARMSSEKREGVVRLLKSCIVDLPQITVEEDVFSAISSAIRGNRQIRITFLSGSPKGQLSQTKVAPYRLVASSQGWDLIGRSSLHRQTRRFSLSQILSVETADDPIPCRPCRVRRRKGHCDPTENRPAEDDSLGLSSLLAASSAGQAADY